MTPSMLCQRQAMPSRQSYSASPACQIASKKPALSHSRNRAWIALQLPYRSNGKARHWHPVRKTYTMAANTRRALLAGRPPPALRRLVRFACLCRTGTNGSTRIQKSFVTSHDFGVPMITPDMTLGQNRIGHLFTDNFLVYSNDRLLKAPFC